MPAGSLPDEKELLRSIATGDEAAFSGLFRLWQDKLYFFLLRITSSPETSEDILQDTFSKLWVQRERLADIQHFDAYLYQMARNQALTGMRRMAQETLILSVLRKEAAAAGLPADEALFQKEAQEKLKAIIEKLPPQQRMVYTLGREQGLRQEEIALQMGLSASTVKNHMTQALRTIRAELSVYYPTIPVYILFALGAFETLSPN